MRNALAGRAQERDDDLQLAASLAPVWVVGERVTRQVTVSIAAKIGEVEALDDVLAYFAASAPVS